MRYNNWIINQIFIKMKKKDFVCCRSIIYDIVL